MLCFSLNPFLFSKVCMSIDCKYVFKNSHHTHRAVEALTVVVIVERLDPPVARLHWETACETFCREQLVPV